MRRTESTSTRPQKWIEHMVSQPAGMRRHNAYLVATSPVRRRAIATSVGRKQQFVRHFWDSDCVLTITDYF